MELSEKLRTKGRVAKTPMALGQRALSPDEVVALGARERGVKPSPLQRVTARHRRMARDIASGMSSGQVARMHGLSPSRVSILLADPTFQDLVARVQTELDGAWLDFAALSKDLAEDSVTAIHDRLANEPEAFEIDDLIKIGQVFGDRAGFAPKRVEEKNITVNIGDKLNEARQRARAQIIETTYEDITEVVE